MNSQVTTYINNNKKIYSNNEKYKYENRHKYKSLNNNKNRFNIIKDNIIKYVHMYMHIFKAIL